MTLIKRLLPSADLDALLGDIVEESHRRSRLWRWSQFLAVVLVGSWRDIRTHKLMAARAMATGLALQLFLSVAMLQLRMTWRSHSWAYVATAEVAWFAGTAAIGWAITRLHRRHGVTMVLAYQAVLSLLLCVQFAGLLQSAIMSPRPWPPAVAVYSLVRLVTTGLVIDPLLMLLGGYFASRPLDAA